MNNVAQFAFHHTGPRRRASDILHVGLVNNMPDAAMRPTELQFARLLRDSAGGLDVRLSLFSLPEIARSDLARSRMDGIYADASTLPDAGIDALIVTGAEPHAVDLRDETFWPSFCRLVDWAHDGTVSTLFSCLAAHAAVLHGSGIVRRPLARKLFGVFDCTVAAEDPLLFKLHAPVSVPHARLNELAEEDLKAHGYRILSRLAGGGVNLFARKSGSLFLFSQGHPEYDGDSLGREYVRDVGRYLRGENAVPPPIPSGYFDKATEADLRALAAAGRDPSLQPRYDALLAGAISLQYWRADTVQLFGNWLAGVAAEKMRRRARSPANSGLRRSA